MAYPPILVDQDGNPIPQRWDPVEQKWVPYDARVQLSGSLPNGSNLIGRVLVDGAVTVSAVSSPVLVTDAPISQFRPRTVSAPTVTRLDSEPLPGRKWVDIVLVGSGTGYIGNNALTGATNGIPITETDGYRLYAPESVGIYGVGGTFLIVEVA